MPSVFLRLFLSSLKMDFRLAVLEMQKLWYLRIWKKIVIYDKKCSDTSAWQNVEKLKTEQDNHV